MITVEVGLADYENLLRCDGGRWSHREGMLHLYAFNSEYARAIFQMDDLFPFLGVKITASSKGRKAIAAENN